MPGKLPANRPVSLDYGKDVIDRTPVKDQDRQTGASTWNDLKADLAFVARMCPLARIKVTNNGTVAAVAAIAGAEGLATSAVTVSRTSQGLVTVDWTSTGIAAASAVPVARHASQQRLAGIYALTATGCTVFTESRVVSGGAVELADSDFDLFLY
jgi:hypothetical protein